MKVTKSPWSAERSIRRSQILMRRNTDKFGSSTSRARTTSTLKDFSRRLNFPKPFAGQYLLSFNHPDAREALFCFVKRHRPRTGGRERSAPVDSPRILRRLGVTAEYAMTTSAARAITGTLVRRKRTTPSRRSNNCWTMSRSKSSNSCSILNATSQTGENHESNH